MGKVADKNTVEAIQLLSQFIKSGIIYQNRDFTNMLEHRYGRTVLRRAIAKMIETGEIRTWKTHAKDRFYERISKL